MVEQSGQAIVLVALLLVLLLGISALAIDGGGVLFLQRDAQNAADAAALSASRWYCLSDKTDAAGAEVVGIARASENGFTTGMNGGTARDVVVTVDVDLATLPAGANPSADPSDFTRVTINAVKPSFFAQLVYKGNLAVSVEAVSECTEAKTFSTIGAMTGFGECGMDTVDFSGSEVYVEGGMNSAGGCDITGSNGHDQNIIGTNNCDPLDAKGDFVDTPDDSGPSSMDGDPLADLWIVSDWAPGSLIAQAASADTCPNAGSNSGIDVGCYHTAIPGDGNLEGVYYLENQGSIPGGLKWGPKGATIVVNDPASGATQFQPNDLDTQASVTIIAPYTLPTGFDYSTNGFDGAEENFLKVMLENNWLLMMNNYGSPGSSQLCSSSGEAFKFSFSKGEFKGVIYASHAPCEASFSGLDVGYGALVCSMVNLSGSGFSLIWDPKVLPPIDPHIGLNR